MRVCSACKAAATAWKTSSWCKPCANAYMRKRRSDPVYKKKELAWKRRAAGVDLASINRPQPANCEVCGIAASLQCDHDHATGKFRGWLCGACNRALGIVKDNPVVLQRLAEYLRG